MDQKEKAVWITGASSGIGKELTIEFANNGILVIATSRRKNLIDSYKKEIGEKAKNIVSGKLDISDPMAVEEFYNSISKKYFIRTLINNAGATSFKRAEEDSVIEIKNIIDVNLLGAIYSIKSVLPEMVKNKSGTIINILSVVTKKVFTNSSAYSASKHGLLAYSNSLREELRDKNIRIINFSPGATKTPIWPSDTLENNSHRMISPNELAKFIFQVYSNKANMVAEEIVVRPIQGDL
ncbi:MAG: SDR family oxidoreductase [Ignavibacteria bacterium]|nr:SDR family oxidoreductase [Ignavibacteria bacterium]